MKQSVGWLDFRLLEGVFGIGYTSVSEWFVADLFNIIIWLDFLFFPTFVEGFTHFIFTSLFYN